VIGDPTAAAADRGEQIIELLARNWAEILAEIYDYYPIAQP
jgi:creatinine amidohydrolase/Fe(II)-dependent formamide hydrolase-like protein